MTIANSSKPARATDRMRLPGASTQRVQFRWNGARIEGRAGDSIAAALHAAGEWYLSPSRKFHQPRGLSGSFVAGYLVTVDGIPNCRVDDIIIREGMVVERQGGWPGAGFDLLRLARFIPQRWLRAGFEHPRWIPDSSPLWRVWERMLAFVAGGAAVPVSAPLPIPAGRRISAATVIVGGGADAQAAARIAVAAQKFPVVVITRGDSTPELPANVETYTGHQVFALYHGGHLVAAAPLDPQQPALLVDADEVMIATGVKSTPPLVPGAALPGVLDATQALRLARRYGVAAGQRVIVIGTDRGGNVADQLAQLGVNVIGFYDVAEVSSIEGRNRVKAVNIAGVSRPCDAVVHAGPWRADRSLPFQAAAVGELRLLEAARPNHLQVYGRAGEPAEAVSFGASQTPDPKALVCPCMDVSVSEVVALIGSGVTHVEELKRRTGCGMGPCQGIPCWDLLAAVVGQFTATPVEEVGHPSYRPPRAAITFGQAAGLSEVTEVAP